MDAAMAAAWEALEARIGYRFTDRALLAQALTHRSYANESRDSAVVDNERFEFLGDAVLDLVVGHALMERDAEAVEGELSRLRAELVSAPSLARLAAGLHIGECLLLGRGEARSGGHAKENLLADALEALVGAVFLDGGYPAARAVTDTLFFPLLAGEGAAAGCDYKTRLQERLQARRQPGPVYRLVAEHGPDHRRSFEIEAVVGGDVVGCGRGATKKRAEQEAARQALAALDRAGGADG